MSTTQNTGIQATIFPFLKYVELRKLRFHQGPNSDSFSEDPIATESNF
jgi:hypothetical protein